VGDGVGFEKTGARFVPLVGLDGDMFFQEGSWLGGSPAWFLVLDSDRGQEPVNGGWRDVEQGLEGLAGELTKMLYVSG